MLIDVHAHIGRIFPERSRFLDVTDLILKMDAWKIERSLVHCLSEHPEAEYQESDTEDVISACSRFPGRLVPFCLIDPRFGRNSPEMDFSYLLEEYVARGCKGMGEMLPKMDFDDPRCLNLFKQVGQFGLPITFDMQDRVDGYGLRDDMGLPKLERTLRYCPETTFVGHGPTFWAEISGQVAPEERMDYPKGKVGKGGAVPRLMREYPNLWADLSAGSGYNAVTRDIEFGLSFLEEFQDRLLFGTDSCQRITETPRCPIVEFMGKMQEEGSISEKAWDKIAWQNAVKLYKL